MCTKHRIRDEVLNYFIDKIYVYDNQLVFTGGYYGRDGQWHSKVVYDDVWQEVKFEGFESFAVGLTKRKALFINAFLFFCLNKQSHFSVALGTAWVLFGG